MLMRKVNAKGIADKEARTCAEKARKQLAVGAPPGGATTIVLPPVVEQP